MEFIDNHKMLSAMEAADDIRYLYDCIDISLAGEDWKVREIRYLTADPSDPLRDYVTFKRYDFDETNSLLVGCHTKNDALIEKTAELIAADNAGEKELRTEFPEILSHPALTERFSMTDADEGVNPIFALTDPARLKPYEPAVGVTVSVWNGENREKIRAELADIGEGVDYICTCCRDTRRYLLYLNGRAVGYLRAECAWKNVYDIGWVNVEPEYRRRELGKQLVLAFAHDCLSRGEIPHYGFAVSRESALTAESCGFVNIRPATRAVMLHKK